MLSSLIKFVVRGTSATVMPLDVHEAGREVAQNFWSAIIQPLSFVLAMLLGLGALAAPYAVAVFLHDYFGVRMTAAVAASVVATVVCLALAYKAAQSRRRGALYAPLFALEFCSFIGLAVIFTD
jgi:hypothetical protein